MLGQPENCASPTVEPCVFFGVSSDRFFAGMPVGTVALNHQVVQGNVKVTAVLSKLLFVDVAESQNVQILRGDLLYFCHSICPPTVRGLLKPSAHTFFGAKLFPFSYGSDRSNWSLAYKALFDDCSTHSVNSAALTRAKLSSFVASDVLKSRFALYAYSAFSFALYVCGALPRAEFRLFGESDLNKIRLSTLSARFLNFICQFSALSRAKLLIPDRWNKYLIAVLAIFIFHTAWFRYLVGLGRGQAPRTRVSFADQANIPLMYCTSIRNGLSPLNGVVL